MTKLSSTISNLIERVDVSIKNLQARLHHLESLTKEDKTPRGNKFQKELRDLKTEVEAINRLTDESSTKIEKFIAEVDEGYIKCRTLEIIERILDSTANVFSKSEYYQAILKILTEELHSDKGLILLFVDGGEKVEIIARSDSLSYNHSPEEPLLSRTLVSELKQKKTVLRVVNPSQDLRYLQEISISSMKVLSVILAPLFIANDIAGCVYLESYSLPKTYTEEEERLMAKLSRVLSSLLVHSITYLRGVEGIHRNVFQEAPQSGIIGINAKFKKVLQIAKQVANSQATVLIQGESGTGKEWVAKYIHNTSDRKDKPLVIVNCAAIPDTLLESELFGHEKGAFTGALQSKVGRFDLANGGTIFLDEIGELPLALQAKLLRFLQFQEFERLGGLKTIKVDVRVIAATSRNLKQMVEQEKFLDALYFRIKVIYVHVPPLRERGEDIILLTNYFLNKFCEQYGKKLKLDPEVYLFLEAYPFPGNVRELENLIHRMVVLCEGDFIGVEHLPQEEFQLKEKVISLEKNPLSKFLRSAPKDLNELRALEAGMDKIVEEYKQKIEQRFYVKMLEEAGGNISELARKLAVDVSNLHKKLKKFAGQ